MCKSINNEKSRVLTLGTLLGLCVLCCFGPEALAQRGGRDDDSRRQEDSDRDRGRRGDDRDDRERGRDRDRDRGRDRDRDRDDDRPRESQEERRARFMLSMDRNGDGKLERSEVRSDRMWEDIERRTKELGLDASQGFSVKQYLSGRVQQERKRDIERQREANPTAFLPPIDNTKAPGFDTPLSEQELYLLNPDRVETTAVTTTDAQPERERDSRGGNEGRGDWRRGGDDRRRERESSSDRDPSGEDKTTAYVRGLIKRYDKNGNSILEGDEWKEMKGSPEQADFNKDGRLTIDELKKRFGGDREDRSSNSARPSRRGGDDDSQERSTYRFISALDRLPKDARSWVEKYDDNTDGQVAMSEFSRTWTDSKVREFEQYDLNGDGIVTAAEYLGSKSSDRSEDRADDRPSRRSSSFSRSRSGR